MKIKLYLTASLFLLSFVLAMPSLVHARTLSPKAETAMGDNYHNGKNGVKQDYKKAVYWYRHAAAQGYAAAAKKDIESGNIKLS